MKKVYQNEHFDKKKKNCIHKSRNQVIVTVDTIIYSICVNQMIK